MAHSGTFDRTTPLGGDNLNTVDDQIRDLKLALDERLQRAGLKWSNPSGTATTEGQLTCGVISSSPDVWIVYEADGSTAALTVDETNLTIQGGGGRSAAAAERYTLDTYTVNANDLDLNDAAVAARFVHSPALATNNFLYCEVQHITAGSLDYTDPGHLDIDGATLTTNEAQFGIDSTWADGVGGTQFVLNGTVMITNDTNSEGEIDEVMPQYEVNNTGTWTDIPGAGHSNITYPIVVGDTTANRTVLVPVHGWIGNTTSTDSQWAFRIQITGSGAGDIYVSGYSFTVTQYYRYAS